MPEEEEKTPHHPSGTPEPGRLASPIILKIKSKVYIRIYKKIENVKLSPPHPTPPSKNCSDVPVLLLFFRSVVNYTYHITEDWEESGD